MMHLINEHKNTLFPRCRKHEVIELYVFGSIVTSNFKEDSDIDFLVHFGKIDLLDYFDNYMEFKDSLAELFGREIDLVETQTVKNPILKRAIDRNKTLIYERKDPEMAV